MHFQERAIGIETTATLARSQVKHDASKAGVTPLVEGNEACARGSAYRI